MLLVICSSTTIYLYIYELRCQELLSWLYLEIIVNLHKHMLFYLQNNTENSQEVWPCEWYNRGVSKPTRLPPNPAESSLRVCQMCLQGNRTNVSSILTRLHVIITNSEKQKFNTHLTCLGLKTYPFQSVLDCFSHWWMTVIVYLTICYTVEFLTVRETCRTS
jgi:hypothetical protein